VARTAVGSNDAEGIQSVTRAFAIMELFSERRPALSVSEIAALTGLNRSTCYRFCQTLLRIGYLDEVDRRHFRPGLKAVSLARAALSSRELPELALPYLRELQRLTDATTNMSLLDGTDVVYVARVLSDHLITLRLYVGSRLPAYASSMGRAMLAFLPEAEAHNILARSDLQPLTPHTITDPDRLMAELQRIRSRGYAINEQEVALGVRGIAAPILDNTVGPWRPSTSQRPNPWRPSRLPNRCRACWKRPVRSARWSSSWARLDALEGADPWISAPPCGRRSLV
jgi:IclR family transcriptional regulator, pca regulon regulatory protein